MASSDSMPPATNAGREIATLLYVELLGVGSSGGQSPFDEAGRLQARHDRLTRDLLLRFDGREIEKARRFLLLFERPIDAVRYGLAYHEAVAALATELDQPVAGRIGIHVGEVLLRENPPEHVGRGAKPLELEGPARSMVARLMSLATGGQTLLTKAPFLLAQRAAVGGDAKRGDVVWRSHGRYHFAGIEEVVEVFEVGAPGVAPLVAPRQPLAAEPRRVTSVTQEGARAWKPVEGKPVPHRPSWMLVRQLEQATYGEVWQGKHQKTGDRRAFRFCFGAEDLPRMHHQLSVVRHLRQTLGDRQVAARTLDSQLEEIPYFLESEHVGRDTLATWAEVQGGLGNLALATRLEVAERVAELVSTIHQAGVAVGNIRPMNLLVQERSGAIHDVLIGDLSQARIVGRQATVDTTVADSPDRDPTLVFYMPPEQDDSFPATRKGDVYALGILLYQLIAGDFDRPLGPFWERDVDDELLREEIARLAEPDPRARPSDTADVARRLRDLEARRAEHGSKPREPDSNQIGKVRRQSLWGSILRRR